MNRTIILVGVFMIIIAGLYFGLRLRNSLGNKTEMKQKQKDEIKKKDFDFKEKIQNSKESERKAKAKLNPIQQKSRGRLDELDGFPTPPMDAA